MSNITKRRYGQDVANNVIDPLLTFDGTPVFSVTSSGAATLDEDRVYYGNKSLRLESNDTNRDIIVTNSEQNTSIPRAGIYQLSGCLFKDVAGEEITVEIQVFVGGSLFKAESFTIGNSTDTELDSTNTWQRFMSSDLSFSKNDKVTFIFTLKANGSAQPSLRVWLDGLMLNEASRESKVIPIYTPPTEESVPDLPTVDGNYQLTITSGVATWTIVP